MEKISMLAMLVVVGIGIREVDLSCWTVDRRALLSKLNELCCQTVPKILSETAKP
jgi:hypothetical protein